MWHYRRKYQLSFSHLILYILITGQGRLFRIYPKCLSALVFIMFQPAETCHVDASIAYHPYCSNTTREQVVVEEINSSDAISMGRNSPIFLRLLLYLSILSG